MQLSALFNPVAFAETLAIGFGVAGAVQWLGLGFVRRAYQRWDFPPRQYRVTGTLEMIAAGLLLMPVTRFWGIVLAGLITFGAVVTLLKNGQYTWAIPGIAILVALAPASLAATT